MNIDELLREHGDRWQPPAVADPDLGAALGRSARRNRVTRGMVAAAAVFAVVGAAWGIVATPDGREVPAVPAPAASPTPTVAEAPADDAKAALIHVALAVWGDYYQTPGSGDVNLPQVTLVGTTAGAAAGLLPAAPGIAPATPVWVLQMPGSYGCGPCSDTPGHGKAKSVLRAVVTQANLEVIAAGSLDESADLGEFGPTSTLKLTDDQSGWLSFQKAVTRHLAEVEKVKVSGNVWASQTTLYRAQKAVLGRSALPLSYRGVWLARLKGDFTCSSCTQMTGSNHGNTLVMVIDSATGDLLQMAIVKPSFEVSAKGLSLLVWDQSKVR
jgi:hypothetical protein